MAVWTAKVTFDNITSTYPGPGAFGYGAFNPQFFQYYAFVAVDLVDLRYPTIFVSYQTKADGTALETVISHGFSIGGDASTGFVSSGVGHVFTGTNEFEGGGFFTILKDETAGEYLFTCPLGSSTVTFASLGGVSNGELAPDSLWLQDTPLSTWDDGTFTTTTNYDTVLVVHFNNFFGQLDGTDIKGATLASGDRGSWGPPSPSTIFDPWSVTYTATMSAATADTGAAIGFNFQTNVAGFPPAPAGLARRFWDQAVYLSANNPAGIALDAVLCPISGNMYVLRVASTEAENVFFARSEDRGASWQEQTLHNLGGSLMRWPTLDVDHKGKILAIWQDGNDPTRRYWAISETFGKTWSAVSSVVGASFAGMRARYHPATGMLFLVYRDTTDAQFKVVAYDEVTLVGFTPADPWATPRVVINQASDHWPALTFSYLGVVQLQWTENMRAFSVSDSMGVDWTNTSSEPLTVKSQPAVVNDDVSGLHYVLTQHPSTGDLAAFASDDGGVTALPGPSGTVLAGADQQYGALVADHRGHLYAIYQELNLGSYVIACKKSDSLSADWVAA